MLITKKQKSSFEHSVLYKNLLLDYIQRRINRSEVELSTNSNLPKVPLTLKRAGHIGHL